MKKVRKRSKPKFYRIWRFDGNSLCWVSCGRKGKEFTRVPRAIIKRDSMNRDIKPLSREHYGVLFGCLKRPGSEMSCPKPFAHKPKKEV